MGNFLMEIYIQMQNSPPSPQLSEKWQQKTSDEKKHLAERKKVHTRW